jgi:hypothetical protein
MHTPRWLRDLCDHWSKTYTTTSGKQTKLRGTITVFGQDCYMTMPLNADGTVHWTLEEIGTMTIRCAWCGKPIYIGDPITLCSPMAEGQTWHPLVLPAKKFEVPDYAVIYSQEPLRLVGCGRMGCADGMMDYAGRWMPDITTGKGKVERHPTIAEHLIAHPDAEVVIANLHNGVTDITIIQ